MKNIQKIMKVQYKAALAMALFGLTTIIIFSYGYDILNYDVVVGEETKKNVAIAKEVASHLESNLKEKARIALTIGTAPIVRSELLKSNAEFAEISQEKRLLEIDRLNRQWKKTSDTNDPFIKSYLTNALAEYLKNQQRIFPSEYGEIFLTNRYGTMIASTGKLTTLAHAHKYWWLACYNDGQGRIFLDDRGFDESVKGYVLGVVVPIRHENEIIGILKCNVNILGTLTDVVHEFGLRHPGVIKISRTEGLVVYESGALPLSTQLNLPLVKHMRKRVVDTTAIAEKDEKHLVTFAPVPLTMGSDEIGFGGKKESIDHIKGNLDEGWHIVISRNEEDVVEIARETTRIILLGGAIFTILAAFVALIFAKWITKPIVDISNTAKKIGEGHLDTRADVASKDEIGSLAISLNQMAINLKETMTSRDNLVYEIEQRKKAEAEKESTILELQKAIEEIKTLRGIIPICAWCKKIRDDEGVWNQMEVYVSRHSQAEFSHGVCPDCLKNQYKDAGLEPPDKS